MSISIQTNVNSLVAQQNLNVTNKFQSQTISQLTSGYRINQSGDDAAGLAVANKFRSSVAELTQGVANGNDGLAQLQIMDGGMNNIAQILDRLKTLATQSASGTFTGDRDTVNSEFQNDVLEIDRQAQSIGLNMGGTFAKSLSVYLGQGSGSATLDNAQVGVDLSAATVDSQSLGLKGLQVVAGTQDIGTGSTTHSVNQIVKNSGNAMATAGYATFYFSGPGFSDNAKVAVAVNLSNVTDINTLVTAINGSLGSSVSQALKSAGITASISTDPQGGQELAFSSSTTAFQVQAGDQMANALMGNLTGSIGTAITTTVTGGLSQATGAFNNPTNVKVEISGAGLASPVEIKFDSSIGTVGAAIDSLNTQVQTNAALHAAGITLTHAVAGDALVFTSATGETFNVQSTGDVNNMLGLGGLNTTQVGAKPFYSSIAGATQSGTLTGNGLTTLGFSFNGSPTDGGGTGHVPKITGIVPTVPASPLGTVNTTLITATALDLTINGKQVLVDFNHDANKSTTESWANVAKYINNTVDTAMGWGSDVNLATVTGAGATSHLVLTDPFADENSSLIVTADGTADANSASTRLGLTAAYNSAINTDSGIDPVGNTVTLNMAGGDATSTTFTTSAITPGSVDTSLGGVIGLKVDGATFNADFGLDNYSAGAVATFTGGVLGADGNSTIDLSALQAKTAVYTGGVMGADGNATLNTGALQSKGGTWLGTALGTAGTDKIDVASLQAKAAVYTGAGLSGTAVSYTGALTINGRALTITSATSLQDVADLITADSANNNGVTAAVKVVNGMNCLQLTTLNKGAGPNTTIAVTNDAASQAVGLTLSGQSGGLTASGTAAQTFTVDLGNKGAVAINFTNESGANIDAQGKETLSNVAAFINSSIEADSNYTGQGYNVCASIVNGAIQLRNKVTGGTTASDVTLNNTTASQALGLTTVGQSALTKSGSAAQTFTVNVDGKGAVAIDFDNDANINASTGLESLSNIAARISTKLQNAGGQYTGPYTSATFASVVGGAIQIVGLNKTAATGTVTLNNTAASQALGLTSAGQSGPDLTKTASDAKTLDLNIDGRGLLSVDFTTDTHVGSGETLNQVRDFINARLLASTTYGANGTPAIAAEYQNLASINAGALEIQSVLKGSTSGHVSVVNNNAASQALGLTTAGSASPTTKDGTNETLQQQVDFLNTATQKAVGTSDQTKFFTLNADNTISFASQTKGLVSGLEVQTDVDGLGAALGMAGVMGNVAHSASLVSQVAMLKEAFTNNTTLQKAGLQASTDGNSLTIASSDPNNKTNFRIDQYGTAGADLGFGMTAGAFTGVTSGTSHASMIDAGGTSVLGKDSAGWLSFNPLQFGTDDQAVTITANSSTGALQNLTLTLQNDDVAQNGATIDSAINYINAQLQASNNPTLRSIVAVKENSGGTEMINFLSSLSSFKVSVGTSVNGNGIAGGAAQKFDSVKNGDSSSISVDSQAGASLAVAALKTAVGKLGSAQAAVGRGENQLAYAISLAQSQITNFSSAESQIRDANVALQAANLSKAQVLSQASIAAMAQANSAPQGVLALLRG